MRKRFYREPERRFDAVSGKAALDRAFVGMRKLGLIARQAFLCCGNCAGSELASKVGAMPEAKRIKVKGVVFYHRQDAARLNENGGTYLAYGPLGISGIGEVGEPAVWIGEQVVRLCREEGLDVEWNGDPDTRVWVQYPGPYRCRCLSREHQSTHLSFRCQADATMEKDGKHLCTGCAAPEAAPQSFPVEYRAEV